MQYPNPNFHRTVSRGQTIRQKILTYPLKFAKLLLEVDMSKTEAIEIFAKSVFNEEKKVISTDELNALVEKAETQQERDFYLYI